MHEFGAARQDIGANSGTALWGGMALCAALGAGVWALTVYGTGQRGVAAAAILAARIAFVFFWLAYTGGAIRDLLGPAFDGLARRSREFGVAFATALLVHLLFVAWLFRVAERQPIGNAGIAYFGVGAIWAYALVLLSTGRLKDLLGPAPTRIFRIIGSQYIAYLFFRDFVVDPLLSGHKFELGYLPFSILIAAGPLLRLVALVRRRTDPG